LGSNALIEICELFYSIQGESSYAGYPCFFIRLAGCNLHCTYCDTHYAYEGKHSSYSISKILHELENYPGVIVEITGGEPLLQKNVYPLFDALLSRNRTVLLETNGSINLGEVPPAVVKVLDIKCPGSGMHEKMDFSNFAFLNPKDEIKFVIGSRDDYEYACDIISVYKLQELTILTFSPVTSLLPPSILADWILADLLPVRLRLQLHTVLWPEKTRGY
jgi:7-carboxy-7-deazaguanine synthase